MNSVVAVASLASATAIASPALAAADTTGKPDAELLALSPKLEALIADWRAQCVIDKRRHNADETARRRAGFPRVELGNIPDDEWRKYMDERQKIRGRYAAEEDAETNEWGENVVWNRISERQHALCDAIYTHKAQTAAGLAVQARAYSFDWRDLWDDEYDDAGARQFAELVCAFVGVTPVALERKNAKRQPARVAKPSIVG
jgi:hypothetical protein